MKLNFAAILVALVAAQAPDTFKVLLAPVPIDLTMQATVTGKGSAMATIVSNKLSISGSFEGLQSAATVAHLHQGKVRGVRGPSIADLTVSKALSGTIQGAVNLTPAQLEGLRNGLLYIQIHSEKAPEGNLWGWLLP